MNIDHLPSLPRTEYIEARNRLPTPPTPPPCPLDLPSGPLVDDGLVEDVISMPFNFDSLPRHISENQLLLFRGLPFVV